MLEARQFEQIKIAARERRERRATRRRVAARRAVESCEEAVRGADVVCTVTRRPSRSLRGGWLKPGAHVNAVGACLPPCASSTADASHGPRSSSTAASRARTRRATTSSHWKRARSRRATSAPSSARCSPATAPGRTSEDEITVFESLGLAVEDLAAAEYIERRARETGIGHEPSSFDRARRDRARPRADRGRGGPDAARPTPRHRHLARSWRTSSRSARSRSAARPTRSGRHRRRSSRAAWSRRAPATWPRASPGRPARQASRRRSSSPTTRRRRSWTRSNGWGDT